MGVPIPENSLSSISPKLPGTFPLSTLATFPAFETKTSISMVRFSFILVGIHVCLLSDRHINYLLCA